MDQRRPLARKRRAHKKGNEQPVKDHSKPPQRLSVRRRKKSSRKRTYRMETVDVDGEMTDVPCQWAPKTRHGWARQNQPPEAKAYLSCTL